MCGIEVICKLLKGKEEIVVWFDLYGGRLRVFD